MLPADTTVMMAARQMRSHNVSAVLVIEDSARLVGIFTERDAFSRVLAEGKDPVATTLADVMTDNPETITPETTAVEAVRLMQAAHCRHMPIVDAGKAVGMVARGRFRDVDGDGSTTRESASQETVAALAPSVRITVPVT